MACRHFIVVINDNMAAILWPRWYCRHVAINLEADKERQGRETKFDQLLSFKKWLLVKRNNNSQFESTILGVTNKTVTAFQLSALWRWRRSWQRFFWSTSALITLNWREDLLPCILGRIGEIYCQHQQETKPSISVFAKSDKDRQNDKD